MNHTQTHIHLLTHINTHKHTQEMRTYALTELHLLKSHWLSLLLFPLFQLLHSLTTNLIYYLEATYLTSVQRFKLWDVSYHFLPVLEGPLWLFSDFLVYTLIGMTVAGETSSAIKSV